MQDFAMSMLWLWICYFIVTIVGVLHTVFNIYALKMSPMDEKGMGRDMKKTKPWHPLYNVILFSIFGWLYMRGYLYPTLKKLLLQGNMGRSLHYN